MYIRSMKECDYSEYKRPDSNAPHEFENLVRDCAAIAFGQDFHLYGRSGQAQHGVDIFSDNWTILIQCKAYKNHKDFRVVIEKEYKDAREHFQKDGQPFFRQFIFATALDTDTEAQEIARNLSECGITVRVWFWDDLLKIIKNYRIHNDGDTYAKGYEETLFLHKNQPGFENVCLKNLFVPQEYRELISEDGFGNTMDDLKQRIWLFCSGQKKMLIIEGDAGTGKSTLAAMLCFEERDLIRQTIKTVQEIGSPLPPSSSLLDGRPLLIIRLRDLEIPSNPEHQLGLSILSHLNIQNREKLEEIFPNAVLLLDGFDELCVKLKGPCDRENMLEQLCGWLPRDCKLILTSRPKCVQVNRLKTAYSFSMISLQHFSPRKREIWLDQYRDALPEGRGTVDEEVARYILSMNEKSVSNLCDTPMTLYLLIGKNVDIEKTKNEWALYHYIFDEAVVYTEYAMQLGGASHPMGSNIGHLLYWITEEIAYKMYCAGETPEDQSTIRTEDGQFLVTGETVEKIINVLLQNDQFRKDAKRAGLNDADSFDLQRIHALCCYWRSGPADGPVEFYHNNIRDFFLCEKIRRELNQLYHENGSVEQKTDRIAQCLVSMFKYGKLNETVCRFFEAYVREVVSKQQDHKTEFPLVEKEHHLLPILYQKLLTQGCLYDSLDMNDHIDAIRIVLLNTALVYLYIYDLILEEGKKISWWKDVNVINRSGLMRFIFKSCVGAIASQSDLHGADLSGADLSGADLSMVDLHGAILRRADLREAYLSGVNLSMVNFFMADLFITDLHRANLREADLREANLREANLREADLRRADLRRADLRRANMCGADLREAYMSEAILPDGFWKVSQAEQIEHLKSLHIPDLKL